MDKKKNKGWKIECFCFKVKEEREKLPEVLFHYALEAMETLECNCHAIKYTQNVL